MSHRSDVPKQSSLSALIGRGMSRSFAEHLTEHVLQLSLFVGRKCCNPLLQSTLVNRPYLVGDNLAFASVYLAGNSERIAMDSRCDRDNDDRSNLPLPILHLVIVEHIGSNQLVISLLVCFARSSRPTFPYSGLACGNLREYSPADVAQSCECLLHRHLAVEDWVKLAEKFRT